MCELHAGTQVEENAFTLYVFISKTVRQVQYIQVQELESIIITCIHNIVLSQILGTMPVFIISLTILIYTCRLSTLSIPSIRLMHVYIVCT